MGTKGTIVKTSTLKSRKNARKKRKIRTENLLKSFKKLKPTDSQKGTPIPKTPSNPSHRPKTPKTPLLLLQRG